MAVALEGEGDLVSDCCFDGGGVEVEAGVGDFDLKDSVHDGLALILATSYDGYVRGRSGQSDSESAEDGELHFE